MSGLLGPLLGTGAGVGYSAAQATEEQRQAAWQPAAQARLSDVTAIVGAPALWWMSPPPEPGIHWTRTGGKSWRVMIVR